MVGFILPCGPVTLGGVTVEAVRLITGVEATAVAVALTVWLAKLGGCAGGALNVGEGCGRAEGSSRAVGLDSGALCADDSPSEITPQMAMAAPTAAAPKATGFNRGAGGGTGVETTAAGTYMRSVVRPGCWARGVYEGGGGGGGAGTLTGGELTGATSSRGWEGGAATASAV